MGPSRPRHQRHRQPTGWLRCCAGTAGGKAYDGRLSVSALARSVSKPTITARYTRHPTHFQWAHSRFVPVSVGNMPGSGLRAGGNHDGRRYEGTAKLNQPQTRDGPAWPGPLPGVEHQGRNSSAARPRRDRHPARTGMTGSLGSCSAGSTPPRQRTTRTEARNPAAARSSPG